jgi:hypothetical protein
MPLLFMPPSVYAPFRLCPILFMPLSGLMEMLIMRDSAPPFFLHASFLYASLCLCSFPFMPLSGLMKISLVDYAGFLYANFCAPNENYMIMLRNSISLTHMLGAS